MDTDIASSISDVWDESLDHLKVIVEVMRNLGYAHRYIRKRRYLFMLRAHGRA